MTTQVKAIKHADVRGKELLYLVIGMPDNQLVVNVGERTYKAVKEMEEARDKIPTDKQNAKLP